MCLCLVAKFGCAKYTSIPKMPNKISANILHTAVCYSYWFFTLLKQREFYTLYVCTCIHFFTELLSSSFYFKYMYCVLIMYGPSVWNKVLLLYYYYFWFTVSVVLCHMLLHAKFFSSYCWKFSIPTFLFKMTILVCFGWGFFLFVFFLFYFFLVFFLLLLLLLFIWRNSALAIVL